MALNQSSGRASAEGRIPEVSNVVRICFSRELSLSHSQNISFTASYAASSEGSPARIRRGRHPRQRATDGLGIAPPMLPQVPVSSCGIPVLGWRSRPGTRTRIGKRNSIAQGMVGWIHDSKAQRLVGPSAASRHIRLKSEQMMCSKDSVDFALGDVVSVT